MSKFSVRDSEKQLKLFGQHVRQLRLDKGWTLEETEEHGWTSWRHLQKIEAGKNITLKTVFKLALLYNVSPDYLLKF